MRKRRPARPYRPPRTSACCYVRLAARHVALLTFLLEAEDNLALPTVVDRFAAVVRLLFCPDAASRVASFLEDLKAMCPEARVCLKQSDAFSVASPSGHARIAKCRDRIGQEPLPSPPETENER